MVHNLIHNLIHSLIMGKCMGVFGHLFTTVVVNMEQCLPHHICNNSSSSSSCITHGPCCRGVRPEKMMRYSNRYFLCVFDGQQGPSPAPYEATRSSTGLQDQLAPTHRAHVWVTC